MNTLEIPGIARLVPGMGGLPRYEITATGGTAHVYLLGAHVTHFAPAGEKEVMFMSQKSSFEIGKPIRGGVPIIFPWFGMREGHVPHGFARTRPWTPESVVQNPDGTVTLTLALESDPETQTLWGEPYQWVLRHRITVGATLTMELEIENRGTTTIRCEEALHTYFQVGDVRQTDVRGLEGVEYDDKMDNARRKRQGDEPIRFTEETDRPYVNTKATCVITDPVGQWRIIVEKTNSDSTIVWNPWIAKSQKMSDFGDDEWPSMVCVETGNIADNTLEIAPGQRHLTRTVLRCEKL